jgi:hypothetical protein
VKWFVLMLVPILAGCSSPRVEVVRTSIPPTLIEPIPVPLLTGSTNQHLELLLSEYEARLARCNDRMNILRDVYNDER